MENTKPIQNISDYYPEDVFMCSDPYDCPYATGCSEDGIDWFHYIPHPQPHPINTNNENDLCAF